MPALLDFPPSLVTAGLVYVARRAAGTYPAWPPCLGALTGALTCRSRDRHVSCACQMQLTLARWHLLPIKQRLQLCCPSQVCFKNDRTVARNIADESFCIMGLHNGVV